MNPIYNTDEFVWLRYRLMRKNALWYCKAVPSSSPKGGSTDEKKLKATAEKLLRQARFAWAKMVANKHPNAVHQTDSSVDCFCPDCLVDTMKRYENKDLHIQYDY